MDDLISRQAAIDECYPVTVDGEVYEVVQVETLMGLPSAQPEKVCIANITLSEEQLHEAVEKAKNEVVRVLPSAQPEIIRCKDCKHNSLNRKCGNAYCNLEIGLYQLDDYCSRGERRSTCD